MEAVSRTQAPPSPRSVAPGVALDGLEHAVALLNTAPPAVSTEDATRVARTHYDPAATCVSLSGERDRNFQVTLSDQTRIALKFINRSEAAPETEMQVQVLHHLRNTPGVPVPRHIDTQGGSPLGTFCLPGEADVSFRAYTFLEGQPGTGRAMTHGLCVAIGQALALLDQALADFQHPAAARTFLWDTMQVPHLLPFADAVSDPWVRGFVQDFIQTFSALLHPRLQRLRHQVIHNDLSGSNLLLCADGEALAGVLDFGDMVHAPRVADLAVAASYLMADAGDPMHALAAVTTSYESLLPLEPAERVHLLDLVLARLVQRIVITEWRAQQFPSNRAYILRSQPAACRLLQSLANPWRADVRERHPRSTLT